MSKKIKGMRYISYEERLKPLTSSRRSLRGDLTEVFKWYRSYNKRDMSEVFRIRSQNRTRNNGLKLEVFG
ncbi:hypothetical protein E2C01_043179 [Portunus trituberculatus]|uniref:Uncharacterized protein n=1 Tax=Portunus trituberculatus TaxID=210409 RepID=A0A5B7FNS4_PORTR|nr:hypothetical protein [Portunus trituberculatus]